MADMDNNGFFNGNGFVVLLLFMLMMGGNWFGFGGYGNNNFGMRDYSARAEIAEGFNTSEIKQGIGGDVRMVGGVEFVDQNPIGK